MRKITKEAVNAFINDRSFNQGNTSVRVYGDITGLYLHGHLIAQRDTTDNTLHITSAGWETNTTRERLNGIPGVSISQRKWTWYLNGVVWEHSDLLTLIK